MRTKNRYSLICMALVFFLPWVLSCDQETPLKTYASVVRGPVIHGIANGSFNTDQTFTISSTVDVAIEYTLDGGGTWTGYTGDVTLSAEGTYTVTARQTYPDESQGSSPTIVAIIDTTLPDAPVISGITAGSYADAQTFTVSGTEDNIEYTLDSGATWLAYSGDVTLSGEGSYTVLARQTDAAGNVSAYTTPVTVVIDRTVVAPVISGIISGLYNGTQTFTVAGETGATIEYSTDGGAVWYTYASAVSLGTDGTYYVLARQTDLAGNVSGDTDIITVTIDMTLPDAPVVSGIAAGTYNTVQSFTVSGETGATIEYTLDGGTTWNTYSAEVDLDVDGTYSVAARQTDAAGNVSSTSTSYAVTIDMTAPENVTALAATAADQTITLTWTDPTGDTSYSGVTVSFTPTATGVTQPISVAQGAETIILTPLDNSAAYTFTLTSFDTAGNYSSGATLTWTILVETPSIDPTPAASHYNSEQTITITCATAGASIRYTTDGSDPSETSGTEISSGDSFELTCTSTVKAIAYMTGMVTSSIASSDYGFQQWTWVAGSDTVNQNAIYGTQGTGDASNIPGARRYGVSWIDSSGCLWLFGGQGYDGSGSTGLLNDLWKYDPATGEWTWVSGSDARNQAGTYGTQGTGSTSNVPGGRYCSISWVDSTDMLWLFGGNGYNSGGTYGMLNDLWKYDPATGEWTWMSGSDGVNEAGTYGTQYTGSTSNIPGARAGGSSTWIDSSDCLWLFGGTGVGTIDKGILNDLWRYDPATGEWTWMSGSGAVEQPGVYGTQGSGSAWNVPGSRRYSGYWIDSADTLWLFGGEGYDSTGSSGYLNDLWRYEQGTLEWVWVSGSDQCDQYGTYGAQGTAETSNIPGARYYSESWIDSSACLWLFGGHGNIDTLSNITLNDLWMFDPGTGNWTWVSGTSSANQSGTYGTQGTPGVSNIPGARYESGMSWIDSSGALWLFGGYGYDRDGSAGYLNDLWKFEP
ncbi:MAG TPA: kelch repeat-containing protein [Spirochaetota bacterium]|nr:kelch repeat-containing protein [Spirochaetota bacterium]